MVRAISPNSIWLQHHDCIFNCGSIATAYLYTPQSWTPIPPKEVGIILLLIPYHRITPLTHPRAHQHPLGLPRRGLPTSSRLRHLVLFGLQCASRPCPKTSQPNCSRPGRIRFQRTRIREDTRSRRGEVAGRLRARQRCS